MYQTLDFTVADDLLAAVKWCHDPQKHLAPASVYRHVLLEQIDNDHCSVTALTTNDAWLQRIVKCQAIVGTKLLLDGEDIKDRLGRLEVWKHTAIRVSLTKDNCVSVDRITDADKKGKLISKGNNLVNTYIGDLDEFEVPEVEWQRVATITEECNRFKQFTRLLGKFSQTLNDTLDRGLWFRLDQNTSIISITAAERGGDRGIAACNVEVIAQVKQDFRFGIQARQFTKCAEVFSFCQDGATINVDVDDLEAPTRIRFSGDLGYLNVECMLEYRCMSLAKGSVGMFYGENYKVEPFSSYLVDCKDLYDGIELQTRKKDANRNDVVLELKDSNLVISKRCDINQKEKSLVTIQPNEQGDWCTVGLKINTLSLELIIYTAELIIKSCSVGWQPLVFDHTYLCDGVKAMMQYAAMLDKVTQVDNDFYEDGDAEPEFNSSKLILDQRVRITSSRELWLLYLSHTQDDKCRVVLVGGAKELTNDYNEAD